MIIVSLSLQLSLDTDTYYFKGYSSWRKIGDVISSIFAIGYHEDIDAKPDVPFFLAQLRKTAFARIFSADKNVSTFLGRPPRMSKRFSNFQIPSSFPAQQQNLHTWDPDQDASFLAETRWSALCASLKEEILELARDKIIDGRSERIGYASSPIHNVSTSLISTAPFNSEQRNSGRLFLLSSDWRDHPQIPTNTPLSRKIFCSVPDSIIFMCYFCYAFLCRAPSQSRTTQSSK